MRAFVGPPVFTKGGGPFCCTAWLTSPSQAPVLLFAPSHTLSSGINHCIPPAEWEMEGDRSPTSNALVDLAAAHPSQPLRPRRPTGSAHSTPQYHNKRRGKLRGTSEGQPRRGTCVSSSFFAAARSAHLSLARTLASRVFMLVWYLHQGSGQVPQCR